MCQWTDGLLYNWFDMTFCCFIVFFDEVIVLHGSLQDSASRKATPKLLIQKSSETDAHWKVVLSLSQSQSRRLLRIPGSSLLELTKAFRYLAVECRAIWISGQQFGALESGVWIVCVLFRCARVNSDISGDFERLRLSRLHSVTRIDKCWTCWIQIETPVQEAVEMNCSFYKNAANAAWDIMGLANLVDLQLCNPGWMVLWGWNCYHTTS